MYTEFHFNVELVRDVDVHIINLLANMISTSDLHYEGLSHEFFSCARWRWLFTMDSYYFNADTMSTLRLDKITETYFLCIRSNIKNYDREIEKFVDWIKPYLDAIEGDFLGFSRYAEIEEPTLIYMN